MSISPGRALWASIALLAWSSADTAVMNERSGGCTDRSTGKPVRITLASYKPLVSVRLNGSRPLRFILDTGSASGSIDRSLIEPLAFQTLSTVASRVGAGEQPYQIQVLGPPACYAVGASTLDRAKLVAIDLSLQSAIEGIRIDGLLGADFFESHVVAIDYPASTFQIFPRDFQYGGHGTVVPTSRTNGLLTTTATIQTASGESIAGRFIVDTGVRTALAVNAPFAAEHRLLDGWSRAPHVTIGIGVGGESRAALIRSPQLEVSGLQFRNIVTAVSLDASGIFASPAFAGIIGADLLRRFRVVLDYPHERVVLEPRPGSFEAFDYDASGLFLLAKGRSLDRIEVFRVAPESPAARAGVQEGDVLVSVDGKVVRNLDAVRRRFRQPGRLYRLELTRGGRRLESMLETASLVPAVDAGHRS